MKTIQITALNLVLLFCASCAYFSTPLKPADKPNHKSAILFGRFNLIKNNQDGFKLGLWLQNTQTGKSHYFSFLEDQPLYGVPVTPGKYRVVGFVCSNREHEIKSRNRFPQIGLAELIGRPFEAASATAVYIGDYTGEATYDSLTAHWQVKSATNNYVTTTREFRGKYQQLIFMPAVSIFKPHPGEF